MYAATDITGAGAGYVSRLHIGLAYEFNNIIFIGARLPQIWQNYQVGLFGNPPPTIPLLQSCQTHNIFARSSAASCAACLQYCPPPAHIDCALLHQLSYCQPPLYMGVNSPRFCLHSKCHARVMTACQPLNYLLTALMTALRPSI